MDIKMSPQRPYLLRALYDWLVDNDCTPHLVVDATKEFVDVPQEHVQDGQIVLNVHPNAVMRFTMDLEHVGFEARFAGSPRRIWVPMAAIVAIYARENGAGSVFEEEPDLEPESSESGLTPVEELPPGGLELIDEPVSETTDEADEADKSASKSPSKSKGRPNLKVVK